MAARVGIGKHGPLDAQPSSLGETYSGLVVMPGRSRGRAWGAGLARHKSEAFEEGEEPVGRPVAACCWRVWGGAGQGLFFEREVGVEVDLNGFRAGVAFSGDDLVRHGW